MAQIKSMLWEDANGVAFFANCTIFITGGTGSLGSALTRIFLERFSVKRIVLFSRDEYKQAVMWKTFTKAHQEKIVFRIGDVRDKERLTECMRGSTFVIHAAALKHVDACEFNPSEAIKTNVIGAMNVIDAAKACGVKRVVALSTDKACNPVNLYGASKLCSDSLMIAANSESQCMFTVVRYGNVFTSRGSVVPFFLNLRQKNAASLPVTHEGMTRFNISLDHACNMVLKAFTWTRGGELYVPKLASYKIVDLVKAIGLPYHVVGIRCGEKIHEVMIPEELSRLVFEFDDHFVVIPSFEWYQGEKALLDLGGKKLPENFRYSSGENVFLTIEELKVLLSDYEKNLKLEH
jgi:UDP-N-acetylglucosamine 4,6-dehydratase